MSKKAEAPDLRVRSVPLPPRAKAYVNIPHEKIKNPLT